MWLVWIFLATKTNALAGGLRMRKDAAATGQKVVFKAQQNPYPAFTLPPGFTNCRSVVYGCVSYKWAYRL